MSFLPYISYFLFVIIIIYIVNLVVFIATKIRPVKSCVNCGGKDFERIKRNSFLKFFYPFLKIQHLWCRRCWEKYYTFDMNWKDKR